MRPPSRTPSRLSLYLYIFFCSFQFVVILLSERNQLGIKRVHNKARWSPALCRGVNLQQCVRAARKVEREGRARVWVPTASMMTPTEKKKKRKAKGRKERWRLRRNRRQTHNWNGCIGNFRVATIAILMKKKPHHLMILTRRAAAAAAATPELIELEDKLQRAPPEPRAGSVGGKHTVLRPRRTLFL